MVPNTSSNCGEIAEILVNNDVEFARTFCTYGPVWAGRLSILIYTLPLVLLSNNIWAFIFEYEMATPMHPRWRSSELWVVIVQQWLKTFVRHSHTPGPRMYNFSMRVAGVKSVIRCGWLSAKISSGIPFMVLQSVLYTVPSKLSSVSIKELSSSTF